MSNEIEKIPAYNPFDEEYCRVATHILKYGDMREDRTGTGTVSVFGQMLRFDLREGFPLLTSKYVDFYKILSEILWFISGSSDERYLAEIHYGKPRDELVDKKTIWTDNLKSPKWQGKNRTEGDLGRIYGVQWRDYRTPIFETRDDEEVLVGFKETDQIAELIEGIKKKPYDRRHIVEAWNPGEIDQMVLPPCHKSMQFYVNSKDELSCKVEIRSNDWFLGSPYNIASYALLTMMIAQVCDLGVGELIQSIGDAHIYNNHVSQMIQLLDNPHYAAPSVYINPEIRNIDDFTMGDFELRNYVSNKYIAAKMAV